MDEAIEINVLVITAVSQALHMSEADVMRAAKLGIAEVPLAENTPMYRAWAAYRFIRGCYEPLEDDRVIVPYATCGGNVLSNVPSAEWTAFIEAHPDLLVRLYQRYEKNLPGVFQFGDCYVEYRPFLYGEALMHGRIMMR